MHSIRLFRLLALWPMVFGLILPAMLDSCSTSAPSVSYAASTPLAVASPGTQTPSSVEYPRVAAQTEGPPQHQENTGLAVTEEQVTFYPTYGYKDGDTWRIPMRIWVHKEHQHATEFLSKMSRLFGDHSETERTNFKNRITDFVAEGSRGKRVEFTFVNDPTNERYQVVGSNGGQLTDPNGVLEGTVTLAAAKATALLDQQKSRDGWLSFHAVDGGPSGDGRVQLVEPEGLSVISDIDDTIKITEIPAGFEVVRDNTFFREFRAVPGMVDRYRNASASSFHYVSGGLWQLYRPEQQFLITPEGFPEGSFHLNSLIGNPLADQTRNGLKNLVKAGFLTKEVTRKYKFREIHDLMTRFPKRKFLLYGDSGECDPEVYREIQQKFPSQIQEVWIRDVVNANAQKETRERLNGMKTIPGPDERMGVKNYIPCP